MPRWDFPILWRSRTLRYERDAHVRPHAVHTTYRYIYIYILFMEHHLILYTWSKVYFTSIKWCESHSVLTHPGISLQSLFGALLLLLCLLLCSKFNISVYQTKKNCTKRKRKKSKRIFFFFTLFRHIPPPNTDSLPHCQCFIHSLSLICQYFFFAHSFWSETWIIARR